MNQTDDVYRKFRIERQALKDEQISQAKTQNQMTATKSNKFWVGWDNLQKYNFILFIVHIIIAFILFFYFNSILNPNEPPNFVDLNLYNMELIIHLNNTMTDPSLPNIFDYVAEKAATVSESSVCALIVSFFVITAAFHLLYALNPGNIYLNAVMNGNNFMRWIEYSITATIMIVIIALLSGVKDLRTYFIIVTSAIAMIYTGQMFETSKGGLRWVPIIIGFVLLIGIWFIIISYFNSALNSVNEFNKENGTSQTVPSWLYAVVYVLLFFYALFGLVPVTQTIFGGNYRRYEYFYLTLSLVSKATLGILVAVGFGQRLKATTNS
jgi:hypothetical protein